MVAVTTPLIGALAIFAASEIDFSKKSDEMLIALAGRVQASYVPNFILEVNKRAESKDPKDAKDFRKAIHDQEMEVISKLSDKQKAKRMTKVCKAIQRSKLDDATNKQIRESGFMFVADCEQSI